MSEDANAVRFQFTQESRDGDKFEYTLETMLRGGRRDVSLAHSTVSGPATHTVLDRRVLARALVLGCHTLRLAPDKPVAFEGRDVTLVASQLDPALRVPLSADAAHTHPPIPKGDNP